MKNFKLHTSIKFVLFAFGLVMALAVLWINSTIISNLREGNRRQIEGIAEVFSQKLSSDHSSDEEQIKDFFAKCKSNKVIFRLLPEISVFKSKSNGLPLRI